MQASHVANYTIQGGKKLQINLNAQPNQDGKLCFNYKLLCSSKAAAAFQQLWFLLCLTRVLRSSCPQRQRCLQPLGTAGTSFQGRATHTWHEETPTLNVFVQ